MKTLEKAILYYIREKNDENNYVSLLGTELKDNKSWRIILSKNENCKVDELPFCPIFKLWLLQYLDKTEITNDAICDAVLKLKDSLYMEVSDYDSFSYKLTEKGISFVFNTELTRDNNKKIGF